MRSHEPSLLTPLLLLLLGSLQPLQAQEFRSSLSANELLQKCRHAIHTLDGDQTEVSEEDLAAASYCVGFIEAAAEAGSFLGALNIPVRKSEAASAQRSIRNCAGPEVDGELLVRMVVHFLEHTPGIDSQSAAAVSMLAIARAYPCDTKV